MGANGIFIPKAGNKTPWFGKFWSGAAGGPKRGLELLGIGLIDVENHDCMTLGALQTPNAKTLERFICVSGLRPNPQVIDKLFKELVLFTSRAA